MYIKKIIGKTIYNFVVNGDNLHDVIMESQKLSFGNVKRCGWCDSDDLILNARKAEGFEYTEVKCLCCKAAIVFGRTKEDSNVFYLRKNDEKKLDWKQSTQENNISHPPIMNKTFKRASYSKSVA